MARGVELSTREMVYGDDWFARFFLKFGWIKKEILADAIKKRNVKPHTLRFLLKVALIVVMIQLCLSTAPAIYISLYYETSREFVSVFEVREYTMCFIWQYIIPLVTIVFYAWQPIQVESLFREIRDSNVFDISVEKWELFLEKNVQKPFHDTRNKIGVCVLTLIWYAAGTTLIYYGAKNNPVWWSINPYYFFLWTLINIALPGYILSWVILRQQMVIRALDCLFEDNSRFSPNLMHSDGCMGLSVIGNYAFWFSTPVVLYGFAWSAGLVFMPVRHGIDPTLYATWVCLAMYVVCIPLFLIVPSWSAHRAMEEARSNALNRIAVNIRKIMEVSECDASTPSDTVGKLRNLEYQYELLEKRFSTWPFRFREMKKFCAVAVLPILQLAAPAILDKLKL